MRIMGLFSIVAKSTRGLYTGVSAHQKKGIWRAIAKDILTLGVYGRQSTHCRKRREDLRRWAQKMAEAQLGMAFQRGRGARRTRILAVAYPELDGHLGASQQQQGASYGGGTEAPATVGAASHRTQEAESNDGEGTSGTEGEGSTTAETGGDSSDSSSNGSSLVVADTYVHTPATGKVVDTPELDPNMVTFIKKFTKDSRKGLDSVWKRCRDKLLDISGPITKILELEVQAKEANSLLDPDTVLEWAHYVYRA
ncbi:hypothetical protein NDU88_004510 [Pleurodeles waltl]|uniref:Uncharacterized protein n=1 Tax=Pleurodeles waltl TaxID=8319 RepID=A0AAV7RLS9_PLEWA|nr:hypothetical protein NDU88_004510 [Pleurodeles waltl]